MLPWSPYVLCFQPRAHVLPFLRLIVCGPAVEVSVPVVVFLLGSPPPSACVEALVLVGLVRVPVLILPRAQARGRAVCLSLVVLCLDRGHTLCVVVLSLFRLMTSHAQLTSLCRCKEGVVVCGMRLCQTHEHPCYTLDKMPRWCKNVVASHKWCVSPTLPVLLRWR